jgi:hypothetical protein
MSFTGLLNQTATIANRSGHSADGRESVGAGTSAQCRAEEMTKMRLTPTGEPVRIDILFFFPSGTTVNVDDRITYNSTTYKAITKSVLVDGRGNTRHLQVEAQRWQS